MKKMILMAAFAVATLSANAQSRFEQGTLTLQPRAGATAAFLSNMPDLPVSELGLSGKDIESQPTGGGIIGVDLEYMVTDRFGIQAGANWGQAGSGWKDFDISDGSQTLKLRDLKVETEYVNVPVTLNYYIGKGLALKAGVQCSFLTRAQVKVKASGSAGGTTLKQEYDQDIKEAFENFDLSIPVGLSYEFKTPFVIDARYNIGITKVNKEKLDGDKDSRNGIFTITFGYKFSL